MATLPLILAVLVTVQHPRCSFSFEAPQGWEVAENPAAKVLDPEHHDRLADCAVGLRPPGWRREMRTSELDLEPYAVRLVFWNRSFLDAAKSSFFGRYRENEDLGPHPGQDWFIYVRQGTQPAHDWTTACCQIVRSDSWAHASLKTGGSATVIWEGAVWNDRHRHSVVIVSDDFERFRPVLDQLLETLHYADTTAADSDRQHH